MKNIIRNWLGIDEQLGLIDKNFQSAFGAIDNTNVKLFQMFHILPFASAVMKLNARDAAKLTQPGGVELNNLPGLLLGIISEARQGNSSLQIEGALPDDVRAALVSRGFAVEDIQGSKETGVFILWT